MFSPNQNLFKTLTDRVICRRINNLELQLIVFYYPYNYMSCNYFCRWITLEGNNISSVPENFENLTALIHLNLNQNRMNVIPVSFTKLKKLQFLFMKSNDFYTLDISVLRNMGHVQKIDLSDNPIVASKKTLEVCKVAKIVAVLVHLSLAFTERQ